MKLHLKTSTYSGVNLLLPLSIILFLFSACGNNAGKTNEAAAIPVPTYPVFKVISQTATLQTDYPATLQGQQNIEIRPKIDGYIEQDLY